jgi:hypothetical protein
MTKYEQELNNFRPHDEMQGLFYDPRDLGYPHIPTAGHGYLVVPNRAATPLRDREEANRLATYHGTLAFYLEEDCAAPAFIKAISSSTND